MDKSIKYRTVSKNSIRFFLICWLFMPFSMLQAETSVWRVEKDGNHIFLGGTLHILTASDFPLPEEFDQAYAESDTIFFETDIGAISSPAFMTKSMAAMSYSDGRTLQSVLAPETYAQLGSYLSERGMPISLMNGFTAGGVSLTITILELQNLGYTGGGVDQHYYTKAAGEGRTLGFFETIDEQLAFISKLGDGIENELILYTLADVSRLEGLFEEMKTHWRTGNADGLYTSMIAEMKDQFPDAYASLFLNRNNAWMPDIEAMFETEETELILVGAAHMAGPDGLLDQLARKGYTVTKL